MRRKPRIVKMLALSVVLAMGAAACGDGDDTTGTGSGGTTPGATELAPATLNGSGATFPKSFYDEVIAEFQALNPSVTVNYPGGGSGKGRQDLQDSDPANRIVDFAGTDGVVKEEDKPKYKGGEFVYVPTVVAPITVSYNLGVDNLTLDADTIARIFQRQITTWDDPAIKALNPDAALPGDPITVARRADSSGTSENFTKYLAAAAPGTFTIAAGSQPAWPEGTQAGQGNAGVAQIVKDTTGAIGYVDLSDAKASGLKFAAVKNKAGRAVEPTAEGASAAAGGATVNPDLTYNPLDAAGDDSYPITAPTWIITYVNQTDKAKGAALKAFLTFLLTEGQEFAEDVDYAPLPPSLAEKALAQVDKIAVPA
jgi:phosphate transport system substrate-binding protein